MKDVTHIIGDGDGAVSEGRRRKTRTDGVAEGVPRQLLGRERLRRAVPVEGVPHARRVDEGQQVDAFPGIALAVHVHLKETAVR